MRQGQQNRRGRNRGGGMSNGSGGGSGPVNNGGNNGGPRKPSNSLNRSYESSGPDIKIRGTAMHIAEKYTSLARDAMSSGDSVAAENYLQHAEHYNRIILAAQAPAINANGQEPQQNPVNGGHIRYQPTESFSRDYNHGDDADDEVVNHRPSFLERPVNYHQQPQPYIPQQSFPQAAPQPSPVRTNGAAPYVQPQPQPPMPQPPLPQSQPIQADGFASPEIDVPPRPRRRRRPVAPDGMVRPSPVRGKPLDEGSVPNSETGGDKDKPQDNSE